MAPAPAGRPCQRRAIALCRPPAYLARGMTPLRLTAPEEALAALLARLQPVPPRMMSPEAALGRVLAEDLQALAPVPAHPAALRDGWAVIAAETLGAGPYAPAPLSLAEQVKAGAALPAGADAVLADFELDTMTPFPQALAAASPGVGLRQPGEEIAAGAVLCRAGTRLRPQHLPALAACGIAEVPVRLPRLALAGPEADSAAAALIATLAAPLAAVTRRPDPAEADLLVVLGGLSEDSASPALAAMDQVLLHGLGARPGLATAIGLRHDRPALLLPGTAEEALAGWWLLGAPALRHLVGLPEPAGEALRLTRKVASTVGLAELVPLRRAREGLAEPLAVGALPLAALAATDLLLLVPPGAEGHEAGTLVTALPLAPA